MFPDKYGMELERQKTRSLPSVNSEAVSDVQEVSPRPTGMRALRCAQYLASFAGRDAVVVARRLVATHFAWDERLCRSRTVGVRCSVVLL